MRVLGVDPGLTRCGFGVVDVAADRRASLVDVTVVGTPAEKPLELRLLTVHEAIEQWLDRYTPDVLAVERVFSQTNVSTVMGVAQVSGVVLTAAARRGIAVALHTPSEVKAAVTGDGRADKQAVGKMVARILRLKQAPKPADAADALALAITHAWRGSAASTKHSTPLTPAQKLWREAEAKAQRNSEKSSATWR